MARERDQALRDAEALGAIPRVEVTRTNDRFCSARRRSWNAQRGVQQTAIALSLFYRDVAGTPRIASDQQLPASLPNTDILDEAQVSVDLTRALSRRPEIASLAAQRAQARVDIDLATNQTRPSLDSGLGVTSEHGKKKKKKKSGMSVAAPTK